MTPLTTASPSPVRLFFWRVAALLTDLALRHRTGMVAAWPYLQLAGGGLIAYVIGRLFGAWAMTAFP